MNKKVVTLIKYSLASAFAIGIFFLVVGLRNIYAETSIVEIMRFLSDGFVIPGVLLLCFGVIVAVANMGSFNGIGYALKHAVQMLIPFTKKKHQTYAQYVESKKPIHGYAFLFIVGAIFAAIGIVFLIIWCCYQ